VDGSRFDAWTRRRVGLAAGTWLSGLVGIVPLSGVARKRKNKKKKCKKRFPPSACRFKKKGNRRILCADCTISQTIQLPNGVTLDGNGKTITLSPAQSAPRLIGLHAGSGEANVVNLTIDGGATGESCNDGDGPDGIHFQDSSGRIENVTIVNVNCGNAIAANVSASSTERTIEVTNSSVTAARPDPNSNTGVNFGATGAGRLVARISDSTFTAAEVLFNGEVEATVDGCTLTATFLSGSNGAHVTVTDTTITESTVGIIGEGPNTVMTVTGNTIVGPDDDMDVLITGVDFRPGSSGSVSNNAISNYFVDGPSVGCAIRVDPDAGEVSIGTNTFPPPGNEQNVCFDA
jgi:hypothetical protein